MVEKYSPKRVNFVDDTFAVGRDRTISLCRGIGQKGLGVPWTAMTRVGLGKELLDEMYRAGCRLLYFGCESGDDSTYVLPNLGGVRCDLGYHRIRCTHCHNRSKDNSIQKQQGKLSSTIAWHPDDPSLAPKSNETLPRKYCLDGTTSSTKASSTLLYAFRGYITCPVSPEVLQDLRLASFSRVHVARNPICGPTRYSQSIAYGDDCCSIGWAASICIFL